MSFLRNSHLDFLPCTRGTSSKLIWKMMCPKSVDLSLATCSYARTLSRLRDSAAKRRVLQSQITTKARCRFTRCIHIQSNVMIHIKYINSIPDFSVPGLPLRSPSDQDNLTPLIFLSSLLSHLYWIIRELSQFPSSLPHLIIRGPIPIRC